MNATHVEGASACAYTVTLAAGERNAGWQERCLRHVDQRLLGRWLVGVVRGRTQRDDLLINALKLTIQLNSTSAMKLFQGKAHSLPASPSGAGRQASLQPSAAGSSGNQQEQQSPTLRGLFSFTRPKTPSRAGVEASSPSQDTGSRSPSRLRQLFSSTSPGREASTTAAHGGGHRQDQLSDTNNQLRQQLEAERRAAEEWKARWNHQNFKLQVLTDILVMHLHQQNTQNQHLAPSAQTTKGATVSSGQALYSSKTAGSVSGQQPGSRQPTFKRPTSSTAADMYSDYD